MKYRRWTGLGLALLLGTGVQAQSVLLDRVAVVVNGQPVTRSRLAFYREYLQVTKGAGLGWPGGIGLSELTPEGLLRVVEIDELLFEGASRVESRVTEKGLQERQALFRQSFETAEAYDAFRARHELTEEVSRAFFSRRLRIEAYIVLKVGADRLSETELQEYYEANRASFGEASFAQVRGQIVRKLGADRTAQRFEQWVTELRERANIQVPAPELPP